MSRTAIRERVARGKLIPVHRGVFKLGPAPLNQRGMLTAAVLTCTHTPLISHESAAGLWGLAPVRTSKVHHRGNAEQEAEPVVGLVTAPVLVLASDWAWLRVHGSAIVLRT